jgi:hypothetical protein
MMELRCEHKLHGILIRDGILEVMCSSALCGKKPGVVVLHQFDVTNGRLIGTKRYKDMPKIRKRNRRVA